MTTAATENKQYKLAILMLIAGLGTALSIMATGFQFGVSNNVFHIPYVLQYGKLAAFRNDAFYQSLSKFTTIVWPVLRLFSNEGNIEKIFLAGHILSRGLAFAALVWFLRANGARSAGATLVATLTVAVCPWLLNVSEVGRHGMFIGYFTQSEITWGPLLAALLMAQRGRFVGAAVMAGIVFLLNAFIAFWLIAILAFTVGVDPVQRRDWRRLIGPACIFLLVCAPVLGWVGFALHDGAGNPRHYSYIEYIRLYYARHFLIEAATFGGLRNLGLIAACGFLSAFLSGSRRFWLSVLGGCVVLLAVGTVLPYLVNHRLIFDLHLLRADGLLEFVALALSICVAFRFVFEEKDNPAVRVIALVAATSLAFPVSGWLSLVACVVCLGTLAVRAAGYGSAGTSAPQAWNWMAAAVTLLALGAEFQMVGFSAFFLLRWMVVLVAIGVLFAKGHRTSLFVALVCGALVLVALSIARSRIESLARIEDRNRMAVDMMNWVRQSSLEGPFLLPTGKRYGTMFDDFQLRTRKTVWVDWKQGAAVMWDPRFYWQWMPRIREVSALHTAQDLVAYARLKQIPYLVLPANLGACPDGSATLFSNPGVSVCRVDAG